MPPDAVVTHGEMMRAFEAFKEANDERLDALERRGGDVVSDEKVARIDCARRADAPARRDGAEIARARRSALERARAQRTRREHKAAFDSLHAQRREPPACARSKSKAMSVGSNPDGGYLGADEIEREIGKRLAAISPIRAHRRRARRSPAMSTRSRS